MDKNLDLFCSILSRETGLTFPTSRYSFVENRLAPLLEKYDCSNPNELIIKAKQDLKLKIDIINTLTTNETWFFRHPEHFEILKENVFPQIIKTKSNKIINIWSAGCSTGAELYSILITAKESIPESENFRINILGSDISYEAIQAARKGIYSSRELRETPSYLIEKYFTKIDDETFKINDVLKQDVIFEFLNLLETWPPRTFDIIFCRNTMIYFNKENKDKLLKKFFRNLELDGYFFTSANEQIDFNSEDCGFSKIYLKNEYIYQKTNQRKKTCDIFFKSPTDLLRATNLLKKNLYYFQYGASDNNSKNKIRYIKVFSSDYDKIIKFLVLHSIEPSINPIKYR